MSNRPLQTGLLSAAGLAAMLCWGSASAADLDYGYNDAPPPIAQQRVEFGSGWYIRGDIGVTTGLSVRAGDEPYSNAAFGSSFYANGAYYNADGSLHDGYRAGVLSGPGTSLPSVVADSSKKLLYDGSLGAGYQFNKWFRADVTVDFHQPVSSNTQGASVPCITGTSVAGKDATTGIVTAENILSTSCTPTLAASLRSYSTLVNGYVDLGTWSIVTPYVGAGVGLSFGHAQASATYYQNNNARYAGISYVDAASGNTSYPNWDRSRSVQYYNLAFALMAGLSFDVFDHTKLDIGYRYLHLGQVLGTNLNAQEVRAGLRYMIDN